MPDSDPLQIKFSHFSTSSKSSSKMRLKNCEMILDSR